LAGNNEAALALAYTRLAEHLFVPTTRKQRPEFAAHQTRPKDANTHFLLLDGQGTLHFRTRSRSAAGRCFELLGVARALDRDRGRGAFDLGEVVPRQLDIRRAEVLLEPVELCGTGDRHDPRLLPEEPRDRDLRESRVLLFRDSAE
jgi:hypothetical protein